MVLYAVILNGHTGHFISPCSVFNVHMLSIAGTMEVVDRIYDTGPLGYIKISIESKLCDACSCSPFRPFT